MSVLERTREFGTTLVVGMRAVLIGRMVWIELICLALIGCLAAFAVRAPVTLYYQHVSFEFSEMGERLERFGLPPPVYPALTSTCSYRWPS